MGYLHSHWPHIVAHVDTTLAISAHTTLSDRCQQSESREEEDTSMQAGMYSYIS
jgi:hypothetical protein